MGMALYAGRRYFHWNNSCWSAVLELAGGHGWKPIGTGPPKGTLKNDWCGTYSSNDGQLFYARDAKRLAAALERFLGAKVMPQKQSKKKNTPTVAWLLGTEGRKETTTFIAFCRKGSFRIH